MRVLLLPASLGALLASQLPYRATDSNEPQRSGAPPLYRVSVVDPSTVAVSYDNRLTPTKINFEGTLLLPHARGDARVLSRQGSTKIEAEFRNVLAPARFGAQFLTYVLWAITPEGRATNLGQIITDHKDHGTLKTSTGLQTFALIVTAEPYYSVTQPSDVVVMKNVLRPDTAGSVATVRIQPELLQRGDFTWEMPGPGCFARLASTESVVRGIRGSRRALPGTECGKCCPFSRRGGAIGGNARPCRARSARGRTPLPGTQS